MAMRADEAISLLQSMFERWDRDSLITVLQMNHGHVEHTIEMILKMEGDSAAVSDSAAPSEKSIPLDGETSDPGSSGAFEVSPSDNIDQILARQMSLEDDESASPDAVSVLQAARERGSTASSPASGPPSSRLAAAAVESGAASPLSSNSRKSPKEMAKAARASVARGRRGAHLTRRGIPVDLPTDFLRLPASSLTQSSESSANSWRMAQKQQAAVDAELAMMVQSEIVAEQLAEEDAARLANANPLNMLGELVYGGIQQLAPAPTNSSQRPPGGGAASSTSRGAGGERGGGERRGSTSSTSSSSSRNSTGTASGGGTAASTDSIATKASSLFTAFGEDVKRKMNEVGVKLQVATGTGGYATTSNDGTSCGIEEDGEDTEAEERLRRRHGTGDTSAEGPDTTPGTGAYATSTGVRRTDRSGIAESGLGSRSKNE
mmetsp:Transcript_19952/g.36200  ORF Transcript_19952/g.36200 Transcript_19952/m.36200 type:complete len:434 (-) Transcript_19952:199-1500(-)